MCGIIACVGADDAVDTVLTGLNNLEYRGYDSAGIAVQNGRGLAIRKPAGEISDLSGSFVESLPQATVGIGHTRWSTHGPPTDDNAHPHTSRSGDVAVVHNGVIANYAALREELEGSETSSRARPIPRSSSTSSTGISKTASTATPRSAERSSVSRGAMPSRC